MPSWWGKKSPKNRVLHPELDESQQNHHTIKSSAGNDTNTSKKNVPSFNEVSNTVISPNSRISPRNSRDFTSTGAGGRVSSGGSSAFSGFDSDRAHPLPRPSISSTPSMTTDYSSTGLRSGSVSVSSVSSSGSSEDGGNGIHLDHVQSGVQRRLYDMKMSPRSGSRTATANTSPIHPRFSGSNLDSPTGRIECHPLPLPPPPGSPTRPPSPLSNTRTSPVIDTNHLNCISKWKKGRLLGRGTFGQVYLGFNSESGQMCAIKEVKVISDDHTSRECLKQLNQEINLLNQLSHPNIVQYYGSELGEETLSVYLEYVSGGSIHKLLQEYGPFTEPVIQSYTRQILSGLAYLHGRNTVHRDIKGANILVDPNGEVKLADFGMAKHITACSSMLSFKGSPYWMAPEVVMNMNGYSLPVDIWSLGCTILEMASSKPPWSQYEGVAAIFKIGNSKDIPEIPDHLSSEAKSFISLCLQREPSARPSALKLLEHPFVRDQGSPRFYSDGNRSPATSSRQSVTVNSRPILSSREIGRTITSLPVSPCSSPLRDYGAAYKSCFLSPTHRSYAFVGQNVNNARDYHSRQPGKIYTPEPSYNRENNQFKFQTSSTFPQ
ncbi:mitogen-activated protein kinase kinase kinase 3-like isoform X2 [Impatiens glandulifera]|uniref:mitogen-activated protein kinase kinase kinase 3-like isoform X2 n=1 Tax=Impatiens glandulifera TaxID=253017 RepID=UPI001FB14E06|nr:mitogen-activated protein kinase kinase kinase 3-like isoform X2 [Impatiens glandulifera]